MGSGVEIHQVTIRVSLLGTRNAGSGPCRNLPGFVICDIFHTAPTDCESAIGPEWGVDAPITLSDCTTMEPDPGLETLEDKAGREQEKVRPCKHHVAVISMSRWLKKSFLSAARPESPQHDILAAARIR